MSGFYKDHPDYGGEVDHQELVARMCTDYDAWCLHTASTTLKEVLGLVPAETRVGAWVKPFASFKKGVNPAYAWEPVLFYGGRNDSSAENPTLTDWVSCPITLRKGLTGAKPPAVVAWCFRMLGMTPDDELDDLFPGTRIVSETWDSWRSQLSLA